MVSDEYEVFGQRLNEVGTPQGTNDFLISNMGGIGRNIAYGAVRTAIALNATENEYLVVWEGRDFVGGLVLPRTMA